MVFSSIVFIFGYLPVVLIGSFFLKKKIKIWNLFFFFFFFFFYAYGEPCKIVLLLFVILLNWLAGILVDRFQNYKRLLLFIAVMTDVGILFFFKYYEWIANGLFRGFGIKLPLHGRTIGLPIGISFFIFQAIAYVADVYRGKTKPQKIFYKVGLYISLFPQLIAGPIVRYTDIEKQIDDRKMTVEALSDGLERFFMGMGKKVVLADSMAVIADEAFLMCGNGELGIFFAWLGAIAYTFQIFFDFSGYSDMAIGLGRMLGLRFPENFKYPYKAVSIKDFWHRWHVSLSSWFRDYVYIPLGGNRKGKIRTYINLLTVWLLTGLWHGADMTFLMWGGGYALCILLENALRIDERIQKAGSRTFHILYTGITFFVVMLLWVVFRAENVSQAMQYLRTMFDLRRAEESFPKTVLYLLEYRYELAVCTGLSFIRMPEWIVDTEVYRIGRTVVLWLLFFMSISYLVKGSYSPFIYFNF